MTRFTASPLLIALMQTAMTLPVFLVGLPAGALADIVNRRRLLLATQGLILVSAALLSVLTFTGLMNAPLLLGFTFVLGLGAILANPAWQAVNAELVPADELPAAVTLSSVSYNLARAVGPALAGLIIAATGPSAVFLLNAIAFLYVVIVLQRFCTGGFARMGSRAGARCLPGRLPGGTAVGSLLWGALAAGLGDPLAILLAALGAIVGLAAGLRWHLADSEKQDLRPWHVTVPSLLIEPRLQEGPVMVQTEYCVDPQRAEDFLRAMHEVRRMRERDGAFGWFVARDPASEERHVEAFMAESWLDYLRQLDRMTNDDHATLDHARSFHLGSPPPTVTSLIGERPNWQGDPDKVG